MWLILTGHSVKTVSRKVFADVYIDDHNVWSENFNLPHRAENRIKSPNCLMGDFILLIILM